MHNETIREASMAARALVDPATRPDDICRVCYLTRLTFEPPVIYCMACGLKIKRGQTFYSTPEVNVADIKGTWCHTCFTEAKQDKMVLEGSSYRKQVRARMRVRVRVCVHFCHVCVH